jgi:hypothetical protein
MKKHNSHLPRQVGVFEGHNGFEKKTPCSIPQETLRRTLDCLILNLMYNIHHETNTAILG